MEDELNFKLDNPGAVKYGNFINYYQFHPPATRISMLPTDIWNLLIDRNRTNYIMDVGCNAGDLTMALHDFLVGATNFNELNLLGVDIDPTLVERACEKYSKNNLIQFKCCDVMSDNTPLEYLTSVGTNRFDIVFCFSITMWIHLNHGDDGLKTFLRKVSDLSKFLVIEPQPWKCYRTAVKRLKLGKSEFPKFKELQIRQDVEEQIEHYILNYCHMEKVMESCRTEWGRKLLFFKRLN